ncbi:MAG: hypothetical protein NC300_11875 [Bacteroidales bacterium]|nr:hypothetical protein [Clostridium sp.]MCM1204830.1 hypothetical protein [Bacteroidales bacterium]
MKKNLWRAVKLMAVFSFLAGVVLYPDIDAEAAAVKVDNNNNSIFTAAEISLNTTYAGNISAIEEEDWYHFVIPATAKEGYFQITFGPEDDNSITVQEGWQFCVYRKGEAKPFYSCVGIKNKTTSAKIPFGAGEYYVKAETGAIYSSMLSNENYNFTVGFTDNAHWETERNNSWAQANPIKVNETYHGNLLEDEDEDCYTFTISSPGDIIVTCGANASEDITKIKAGWNVLLYKENESSPCVELSQVKAEVSSAKSSLSAGTYRIRICGGGYGTFNPTTETYDFKITYTDDATSMKKSKMNVSQAKSAAKRKVYLKWKKNKYADGYKVYRSTKKKKGYKCIATLKKRSKVSYTDTKVKSKKVYFYKVCAYRKIGKKTIYSSYSPVKRVKVK